MVGEQKVCIKLNKIRNSQKAMLELQIPHHPECIKKSKGKISQFLFFWWLYRAKHIPMYMCVNMYVKLVSKKMFIKHIFYDDVWEMSKCSNRIVRWKRWATDVKSKIRHGKWDKIRFLLISYTYAIRTASLASVWPRD